ncbi:hypothetical protein LOY34_16910 [Pseudomonas sp. B21-009]|nr:hypothetical protein [Pseudomonas sp. B21-009]UVM65015.1 hypothetical protein LOY34_16910 [Pseudomonas sp. B21-009]
MEPEHRTGAQKELGQSGKRIKRKNWAVYRLRKRAEHQIRLSAEDDDYGLDPANAVGRGMAHDSEKTRVSEIIKALSDSFVAEVSGSLPASLITSAGKRMCWLMVTKRAGQIECKREVKWSAVFQWVFQQKIKPDINLINQYITERIQITPAH